MNIATNVVIFNPFGLTDPKPQHFHGGVALPRRKDLDHNLIQRCVENALLQLMKTENYNDIAVGEIAGQAGIHRATFYRHFTSKEEVLRCCLFEMLPKNGGAAEVPKTDFESFIFPVFQAFYDNKAQLLLLNKAGLSGQLLDVLKDYFAFDEIPDMPVESGESGSLNGSGVNIRKFRTAFRIGGIYSCLLLWFSHDMRETPAEMTKIAASV